MQNGGMEMTTRDAEVQGKRWKDKMQTKMSITCMRGMQRTHVRYKIKLQWSHVALQTYIIKKNKSAKV
jgi:hypothetical protein